MRCTLNKSLSARTASPTISTVVSECCKMKNLFSRRVITLVSRIFFQATDTHPATFDAHTFKILLVCVKGKFSRDNKEGI